MNLDFIDILKTAFPKLYMRKEDQPQERDDDDQPTPDNEGRPDEPEIVWKEKEDDRDE